MKARGVLASALVALLVSFPTAADARDATDAEVRSLVQRAANDPGALAQLRSIDSINGSPVDLARALDTSDRSVLAERLSVLGRQGSIPITQGTDPSQLRDGARDILRQRRFQPEDVPRPFKGLLDAIGRFLDRYLGDPISRTFRSIARLIPGHETTLWIILTALIVGATAFIAWRIGRRRATPRSDDEKHVGRDDVERTSAAELERRADRAESEGDLAEAVRLRFLAGLLRLDEVGVIEYLSTLTAGQVRRKLRLTRFDEVSRSFEQVTYGGRDATTTDLAISKTGWADVLQRVKV